MPRPAFLFFLLVTLVPAGALGAGAPSVRLAYQRATSAADCPDAEVVQQAVRARLGYDPFREPAEIVIRAAVGRQGKDLRARVVLESAEGASGERSFDSQRSDCTEIASAMELAIAIAIDPLSAGRAGPTEPEILPVPKPPPEGPPPEPRPVEPEPARSFSVMPHLSLVGSLGNAPSFAFGLIAGAGIRRAHFSFSLEGRAHLPTSKDLDGGGSIRTSLYAVTVAPCYHLSYFGACALATLGAMHGTGVDLLQARGATTLYSALGARVLFEAPSRGGVALRAHADLCFPLSRTEYTVGGAEAWRTPVISVTLGIGLALRL